MEQDVREEHERVLKTVEGYSPDIATASVCGHCARPLFFKGNIGFMDADDAPELKLSVNTFTPFKQKNEIDILSKVRYAKYVYDQNKREIFCNHCGATYNTCLIQRILSINVLVFI